MAEVPSTFNLRLGAEAPPFTLPDPDGMPRSLPDLRGEKGLLVAFACNHCPFVVHVADSLGALAKEIAAKGVATVAIGSNDVEKYPQDAPEHMPAFQKAHGWGFHYLYDATQEVAQAYHAACTPDFYLFDESLRLVYAGQYDDSRPGNGKPVTGESLRAAVEALLAGNPPVDSQRPSTGCNIKWKPGTEPAWFAAH